MVAAEYDPEHARGQIILHPNQSWTWRANSYFVMTLLAISMAIGAMFTLRGFWLILPFSVLEMSALFGCLYYCVRRTHTLEILRFTADELVFERGIRRPTERKTFQRYFSRFFVQSPRHPWYQKRIQFRCRDEQFEIGRYLTDADRDDLLAALRHIIRRLDEDVSLSR